MFSDHDDTNLIEKAPIDGRAEKFHKWLDLDNRIESLGRQQAKVNQELHELRKQRAALGRTLVDIIEPCDKAAATSTGGDDW